MAKLIQYCTHASLYDGAFDSVVGWAAAGMGYIITSSDGLIAVDGGLPEDAESFVELIEKSSSGTPRVKKWIITHPHLDHYGALRAISENEELRSRIAIEELVFYFPAEFMNNEGTHICAGAQTLMKRIAATVNARIHTPAYNERETVGELELHYVYAPDDCSIFKGQQNANVCSLIFTVQGEHKKAILTGDAFRRSLQMTFWRFGKDLKCDILQMPHHGLCDTGVLDFYKAVNADTVLVPISKAGDRSMHSGEHKECDTAANLWAEQNAKELHKAFEGTVAIEI